MSAFTQLDTLVRTIDARKDADPKASHVAKMLKKGTLKIAKKLGEEAVETAIAAANNDREQVVYESSDLLFHLMLLWHAMGVSPAEVMQELARRDGVSGIAEKASRPPE